MVDRCARWFDEGWLDEQISLACATEDPVLCNLLITLGHYELSLALREVIGPDAGANFHTWAVWGSKKAGKTIRREDLYGLVGAVVRVVGRPVLGRASRKILGGNATVLEDIGRVSARFACAFHDRHERDEERLEAFLATMRPGPPSVEGQDLLAKAFRHYWLARHEPDVDAKHEHMLLGNLQAILHEHVRLEPYIGGAMPRPLRRAVTARLLDFHAGEARLRVSEDVPDVSPHAAPTSLRHITNPDLERFLTGPGGFDRTPDSHIGSRARDWGELRDRMNYIVDLFRSRHFDVRLFDSPYTEAQWAALLVGHVPPGPL